MPPKVSVIVPVHNPGMYLRQSLDTILDQTLSEIEVICVDDGSTDGSAYLLQQYAQKDKRIKLIHQKNTGAGAARNRGMEEATGEYTIFLDADDFFEKNMLEYMYNAIQKDKADIIICTFYVYDNEKKKDVRVGYQLTNAWKNSPLTPEMCCNFVFTISTSCAWTKLIKTSFIKERHLQFALIPQGEDLFFTYQVLSMASKISVHNVPLVHYRLGWSGQCTSISGKTATFGPFLKMVAQLYQTLSQRSIFFPKQKDSFILGIKNSIRFELEDRTGPEKRKALQSIRKELPDEIVQKLFFDVQNPAVSIIVPVFNMEQYLPECLESLIHQTLHNIEIICVDDGSTDSSLKILKEYAEKDQRIKILTQKNQKQSIARRNAMEIASGEYIQYVDADDYLELDACECLYFYCKIYDLDFCSFMSLEFLDTTREDFEEPYHRLTCMPDRTKAILSINDFQPEIIQKIPVSACLTFYKNKFLKQKNIQWLNEALFFEDNLFFTECLFRTQRFGFLKETFYHRRIHEKSVTHNMDKIFSDWCNIKLRVLKIVKLYGNDEILQFYLKAIVWLAKKTYDQFSPELQSKYQREMQHLFSVLVDEYHFPLSDNIQKWYDTLKK